MPTTDAAPADRPDLTLSTADLEMFFDERHRALADRLPSLAASIEDLERQGESARAVAEALGASCDLYQLYWPESGAGEVDVRSLCLVREALGFVSPLADALFAVQGLGTYPIAAAGNPEQASRWVPPLVAGTRIAGFALTEPDAGSDVAAMATTARREGDDFVIDGEKTLISNVGIADQYVVFAKFAELVDAVDKPHKAVSAFVVDAGSQGLTEEPIALGIDHPLGTIRFDGCRVPADALLGREGDGFSIAMNTLDSFRVTVGAAAVGMARRALAEATGQVCGRRQFGRRLADQQIVKEYLAEMATELDAARLLVLRAAYGRDHGSGRGTVEAAMAKLFATEAAQRIVDRAVQLFGGQGVVMGQAVERLYRAIRPLRIYEGTSEIQRLIIGGALVKETS